MEELAALEAAYRPFAAAAQWAGVRCDTHRWDRHAQQLRTRVDATDPASWHELRGRFLRAAALESSALSELVRPAPEATTFVLHSAVNDEAWSAAIEATRLVVECHRRALVVATDLAESRRPLDVNAIAVLQDLIVESQETYTVSDEHGTKLEVEMPKRQYKPVSNYVLRTDGELVSFSPATRVAAEMDRLIREFASTPFVDLHPVVQAAYAHMAINRVHPFADGNGRLARTIASMPLLREVGLPQLVLADEWPSYVEALMAADNDDLGPIVDFFLAAQVNAMGLACDLLDGATASPGMFLAGDTDSPERILLDLVEVHLRERMSMSFAGDRRVAVTRRETRVVVAVDEDGRGNRIEFSADQDGDDPAWVRLDASTGDRLEVWCRDASPEPTEIAHLRVQAWLDRVLRRPAATSSRSSRAQTARGLFVLGVPRSGTTAIGNFIGSHPDVVDLAEYGGFYIAHSVAPAYVNRLPGHRHGSFLTELRALAVDHATRVALDEQCAWFCDATPWNLEVAGEVAGAAPDAVFVLMLRHFSGCVLSLRPFHWAGGSWTSAARLWSTLNQRIAQLPEDRTIVVGYDEFAAHPAETVAALRDALASVGLDPTGFDDARLTASHAAVVGRPRPTVATTVDDRVVFSPIASLDESRWTEEVHGAVWPEVREIHRALADRFPGVYVTPPRPDHVPRDEW